MSVTFIKAREEGYFSFIMMDVEMQRMNGLKATKTIQEYERGQNREENVAIYFVSGEHFDEEEMMIAYGKTGVINDTSRIRLIRKPVDLEAVKATVVKYKKKLNKKDLVKRNFYGQVKDGILVLYQHLHETL